MPIRTVPGALDLTNEAIASGSESTTPQEVARQLHMIAVEEDTTLQAIMAEAFNDVSAKWGKPQIA
jgi:hypothetical protein